MINPRGIGRSSTGAHGRSGVRRASQRALVWRAVSHRTPNEPAVDIGMPAFRRPQFIREAIESVLSQTHTNWRLVVSENGPGGGEVELTVRAYTERSDVSTMSRPGGNLGPAANWTRLIEAGSAPYVTLIQDDDRWDPDFLARRMDFLEQHASCAFVFSGTRAMDRDGREVADRANTFTGIKDVSEVLPEGVYAPREFFSSMYRHQLGGIHTPAICSVGVMSRRSATGGGRSLLRRELPFLFWDVELYLRMALRFPTGFLAVRDATQRLHHPSLTSAATSDGELWIRWHDYHGEWIRRMACPGSSCRASSTSCAQART